ncbi:hypothetical protein AAMO2058_001014800 [Amorphochlora amoebiformis]|mmetsp:Transcript_10226/g.16128  ORF Transcript_10226/g.16128 Transcript_10226/m.16128 type:complete len:398 (-) Transcript_10226:236-1429(-)
MQTMPEVLDAKQEPKARFSLLFFVGLILFSMVALGAILAGFTNIPWKQATQRYSAVFDEGVVVPEVKENPFSFRVMSFNVRRNFDSDGVNKWSRRTSLVKSLFDKEKPDIIGMQEVLGPQMGDLMRMLPEYNPVGVGREDGKTKDEFVPVFYRADKFNAKKTGFFWLSESPEVPGTIYPGAGCTRVTSWALLEPVEGGSQGVDILFLSTHLDHVSFAARSKGAMVIRLKVRDILSKYAAKDRGTAVILVGDFNAEPEEPALDIFLNDMYEIGKPVMQDSRLSALMAPEGRKIGTFPSWNSMTNGKIIDYVLYTPTPFKCIKVGREIAMTATRPQSREDKECLRYILSRGSPLNLTADTYRVTIDEKTRSNPTQPSDHRPVVVDFRIERPRPRALSRA